MPRRKREFDIGWMWKNISDGICKAAYLHIVRTQMMRAFAHARIYTERTEQTNNEKPIPNLYHTHKETHEERTQNPGRGRDRRNSLDVVVVDSHGIMLPEGYAQTAAAAVYSKCVMCVRLRWYYVFKWSAYWVVQSRASTTTTALCISFRSRSRSKVK